MRREELPPEDRVMFLDLCETVVKIPPPRVGLGICERAAEEGDIGFIAPVVLPGYKNLAVRG